MCEICRRPDALWREIGFGPDSRSWAVILLWSIPMLILIGFKLMSGSKELLVLLFLFIQNNLRNGFFEEFLFRGPLLSRLNLLLGRSYRNFVDSGLERGS